MIKESIAKLIECQTLTNEEAEASFNEMMNGEASPAQIAAFITALRMKGETPEEIASGVRSMQSCMSEIKPNVQGMLLDTCGTGGDAHDTFNISTTSAFVAAAAGCSVAKHGNRAVSSKSGSADVLETLGIKIDLPAERVKEIIEKIGIGFLFAPMCHGAMKHAIAPRKEIGIRTVFNILGPIVNPANAQARLLGVYNAQLAEKIAKALQQLNVKRAMVVHGMEGLDEISLAGETTVYELKNGELTEYKITPEQFNLKRSSLKEIEGGDSKNCAKILKSVLEGKATEAQTNAALLNAGAGIYLCEQAASIEEGINKARDAIASGKALEKLDQLIAETNK